MNKKGLLDISNVKSPTEVRGTCDFGKNSPKAIIFYKANGENLPNSCYQIHLTEERTSSSVEEIRVKNKPRNHSEYRSDLLKDISHKCQLFREFESGERRLHHDELFGVSTNIIHIERGIEAFRNILSNNSDHYDSSKRDRWDFYLKYSKEQNYNPTNCNIFCPYRDICNHGSNILSTV